MIFMRREPEDLGLLPDGGPSGRPSARPCRLLASRRPVSARRALLDPRPGDPDGTFWRLVLVFSVVQMATNSVGVHRIPSFMDRGLDPILISYATALDAGAVGVTHRGARHAGLAGASRYLGAAGFLLLALSSR